MDSHASEWDLKDLLMLATSRLGGLDGLQKSICFCSTRCGHTLLQLIGRKMGQLLGRDQGDTQDLGWI